MGSIMSKSALDFVRFAVFGQNVVGYDHEKRPKYGPTTPDNRVEITLFARRDNEGRVETVKDVIDRLKKETSNAYYQIVEVGNVPA